MSNQTTSPTNSQSLVIEKSDFDYITVAEKNGKAATVKFQVMNPSVTMGDVLVILEGAEILFHGLISNLEDGWATATDPGDSLLPVNEFPKSI